MRRIISHIFILLLVLLPVLSHAQRNREPNKNAIAFGIIAHTHGFGIEVQQMMLKEDRSDFVIGLSLSSFRNSKELKIESAYKDQGGKDYVYDKKNFGYIFAPTFGISRELIPKGEFNRISVRSSFSLGPAFALLKPYYIEVAIPIPNNPTQALVEVDKYDASLYNYTNIVGEADFFLGLNEIGIQPGLRAKFSTMVDFSSTRDYIRAFEVSLLGDFFFKELELLDLNPNRKFFLGGSVSFLIGNSW